MHEIHKSRSNQAVRVSLLGIVFLVASSTLGTAVYASSAEELEPLAVHPRTSSMIVDHVRTNHLDQSRQLNDETSSDVFDRFFKVLDRRRMFFLQSDIEEFEKYRYELDDVLKVGELDPGFEIFNRQMTRVRERYEWLLERLDDGLDALDFETDRSVVIDRSDAAWPASKQVCDELWERELIDIIIRMRLDEDSDEEIVETLGKRYRSRLKLVNQTSAEDAFQLYMNAFATTYDPHTLYMSPHDTENFSMNMSLSLEGIGAVLDVVDDVTTVVSLVSGGPADLQGTVQPDDKIIAVGQDVGGPLVDVVGWRIRDVVDLIRGPKGTVVVLNLIREEEGTESQHTAVITRDTVKLDERGAQSSVFEIERDGKEFRFGVILLKTMYRDFRGEQQWGRNYRSTTRDVMGLIRELKDEDIDGLILDLRGNTGGALDEARALAGLFIRSGPVVQIKGAGGRPQVLSDNDPRVAWEGPLAVMVNRRSASAAEIFAGAIQDYRRGIVVGNQTYGKGSVQTLLSLNRGQLKITNAKYYRVSGESTQHQGVFPDIVFPADRDVEQIGENTLDNALPADTIDAARYSELTNLDAVLPQLNQRHHERIAGSAEFDRLHAFAQRVQENKKRTQVSINEEERRAKRQEEEAWFLSVQNEYLVANEMEPAETHDQISDRLDELDEKLDREVDFLVEETGNILADWDALKAMVAQTEDEGTESTQ